MVGEDGAPLKYPSAAQVYDDALEAIEAFEAKVAKKGPDDWYFAPLASLGAGLPKTQAQPSYEQMLEEMLRDKRELYEPDDITRQPCCSPRNETSKGWSLGSSPASRTSREKCIWRWPGMRRGVRRKRSSVSGQW